MLLDFRAIKRKYNLRITGVIQVGAHWGQEVPTYAAMGIKDLVLIEPCKAAYKKLRELYSGARTVELFNVACGEMDGSAEMYAETTNQGQSNSLLKPLVHLEQHSDIIFDKRELVTIRRLDDLIWPKGKHNLLNMDCQGYELNVLKGAPETLKQIDYIFTKVNRHEMYEGCALLPEVDKFLSPAFIRVETGWASPSHGWGDAFYIRKSLI